MILIIPIIDDQSIMMIIACDNRWPIDILSQRLYKFKTLLSECLNLRPFHTGVLEVWYTPLSHRPVTYQTFTCRYHSLKKVGLISFLRLMIKIPFFISLSSSGKFFGSFWYQQKIVFNTRRKMVNNTLFHLNLLQSNRSGPLKTFHFNTPFHCGQSPVGVCYKITSEKFR